MFVVMSVSKMYSLLTARIMMELFQDFLYYFLQFQKRKYSVIRLSNDLENPRWCCHGFISKPAIFNATCRTNCFLVWHCGEWRNRGLLHVWLNLRYNFQTNDFAAFTLLRKEMGLCPGIEHLLVKQVCNASCCVDEFGNILSRSGRRVPLQDKLIFVH